MATPRRPRPRSAPQQPSAAFVSGLQEQGLLCVVGVHASGKEDFMHVIRIFYKAMWTQRLPGDGNETMNAASI